MKFVHYYTSGETFLNSTQAAIKAGYSPRTARVQGSKLLTYPDVQDAVEKHIRKALQKTDMLTADWLKKIKTIIAADMRDVAEWGPDGVTFKESSGLTDEAAYAVSEVAETKTKDGGSIRVKLIPKEKGLDMLGKFLALYTENRVTLSPGEALTDMGRKERQARIAELTVKRNADADGS